MAHDFDIHTELICCEKISMAHFEGYKLFVEQKCIVDHVLSVENQIAQVSTELQIGVCWSPMETFHNTEGNGSSPLSLKFQAMELVCCAPYVAIRSVLNALIDPDFTDFFMDAATTVNVKFDYTDDQSELHFVYIAYNQRKATQTEIDDEGVDLNTYDECACRYCKQLTNSMLAKAVAAGA